MKIAVEPLQKKHREILKSIEEMRKPFDSGEKAMPGEKLDEYERLLGELKNIERTVDLAQKEKTSTLWSEDPEEHKGAQHPAGEKETHLSGKKADEVEVEINGEKVRGKEAMEYLGWSKMVKHGTFGGDDSGAKEFKDIQADNATSGGYLVAPRRVVNRLLKNVDDAVMIRRYATVERVGRGQSLGVVTLDDDFSDVEWVAELSGGEDDELTFGDRELEPHPAAKVVKISNTLLAAPGMNSENIVMQRLQYRYQATQEKHYMTGSGARKPLGIFTPSADGYPTSRDVTGGTANKIDYALIMQMIYNQKEAYWANSRFVFNRQIVEDIRSIQNPNGQYLWQPNFQQGQPQTISGFPFIMSEFAPAGDASGEYVGFFGDLRFYWIVDALNMTIMRNPYKFMEKNQTAFYSRYEGDGQPVLAESGTRAKLT